MFELKPRKQASEILKNVDLSDECPLYLKKEDAAKLLQCCERSIDRWLRDGLIAGTRVCGGKRLIPRAEIERVLSEGYDG